MVLGEGGVRIPQPDDGVTVGDTYHFLSFVDTTLTEA